MAGKPPRNLNSDMIDSSIMIRSGNTRDLIIVYNLLII